MGLQDRIEMVLPCKADYVIAARLAASGIAGRLGFDIETVEDIKVAVSEVCTRIIDVSAGYEGLYKIIFDIFEDRLAITFTSEMEGVKCIFKDDDGLGMAIIDAFMDSVEFCPENNYILSMTKSLEVGSGNGE